MIKISIITINHNDKAGLERTIKSVQNQTALYYEHIVIDGDSTDGSKTLIEKNKSHFSYWVSEPDSGIYNAMNKGVKVAKGNYLLFLNSGDSLVNSNIISWVSKNVIKDRDIYYGDLLYGDETSNRRISFPSKLTFDYFYNGGFLPHPSSFIKKSLFTDIGLYNENFKIISDWDFFVQAICKYNVSYQYFEEIISYYDVNGISANKEFEALKKQEKQIVFKTSFGSFLEDYKLLKRQTDLLNSNRFKFLQRLEQNKFAQKLNSAWLRILNKLFLF